MTITESCLCLSRILKTLFIWFTLLVGIASEMSVWDGVVVSALEKAYEKPPERPPQDDDGDDMDADDDPMETTDN